MRQERTYPMDLLSVTTSMSQHTGTSAGASGAWNEGATKVDKKKRMTGRVAVRR